jgi:beta-glucosidase
MFFQGRKHKQAYIRRHNNFADNRKATVPPESLKPVYAPTLAASERVEKTLASMSLAEKVTMLGGVDHMGVHGLPRLGLGRVWCSDASAGVRNFGPGTAFPAPVALAASWNRALVNRVAAAIAEDCRAVGVSILLGPGVNIARVPTCGRNFEYMGEDPLLAAELGVAYIEGVQDHGVAATVKHFACNNSEYDRHRMDAVVDERTLHEIYLPAFRAAVQRAGVRCVMSSYNGVNGRYASENPVLLRDILRREWGFRGLVMSDWNSVYGTVGPLEAGMDLEMPRGVFYSRGQIEPMVSSSKLSSDLVDEKVRNILRVFYEMGFYDRPAIDASLRARSDAHRETALEAAREGIVLLKNERAVLPLDPAAMRRVVLVGPNAAATPAGGGGSSRVRPDKPVSIEQGLRALLPAGAELAVVADRGGRLSRDGERQVRDADAVIACVGFDHELESESFDRAWRMPDGQPALLRRVAALNPRTIVVLTSGGDLETGVWIDSVPAVLHTMYLGERSGDAIAEALTGVVNPGGKLPFTMARRYADHRATASYVRRPERTSRLLTQGPRPRRLLDKLPAARLERMRRELRPLRYAEGLAVGYRHFDAAGIEPRFAFGHGLSYTTFELGAPRLSARRMSRGQEVTLTVALRNTGSRPGAEVVQVYVEDVESSLPRPRRELKAFDKAVLAPGESREITLRLDESSLSFYDPARHAWVAEAGLFRLRVGTGSRALAASVDLEYEG